MIAEALTLQVARNVMVAGADAGQQMTVARLEEEWVWRDQHAHVLRKLKSTSDRGQHVSSNKMAIAKSKWEALQWWTATACLSSKASVASAMSQRKS